jgi:vanillate/3-O-methylgallate O-demethylase
MPGQSLEDVLQTVASPVELLRNAQTGPRPWPSVPPVFSNWFDEQRSWREGCALFDLSHHMTDLFMQGPDVIRLLSDLGVNSFENFDIDRGKHYVVCNHDGYVIGDVILYHVAKDRVDLVGRPSVHNWLQYHIETGGYDVATERDENSAIRQGPPNVFRYQLQGPHALEVIEKVTGAPVPEVRFFNMTELRIAGQGVRALRHGMAGQAGLELSGPWEYAEDVRGAILEAGRDLGIRPVGTQAYQSSVAESGWIPCPLPAVFTAQRLKAYREWLPANGYEGTSTLGGSFYSQDITDYYFTPYDLGYGRYVSFDHDFIGRDALAEIADAPRREKVTLVLDWKDVTRVFSSMFGESGRGKHMNFPSTWYSVFQYDAVLKDGEPAGISTYIAYTSNERSVLCVASVDVEHSEPGTEVTLLWGEEPNSTKPQVEAHVQMEIGATVAPAPYAESIRAAYRT